jgi:hypothetical protein
MTADTPPTSAATGHFVFAWRKGEKPRLIGPFGDVYAANRRLRRFTEDSGYYAWVLQPEPTNV